MNNEKTEEQLAQDKEWEVMFNLLNADIPDPWQGSKGIEVMVSEFNLDYDEAPF